MEVVMSKNSGTLNANEGVKRLCVNCIYLHRKKHAGGNYINHDGSIDEIKPSISFWCTLHPSWLEVNPVHYCWQFNADE